MAERIMLAKAEQQLQRAGYRTERESHPSVDRGRTVFLAVRPARRTGPGNMPTRLAVCDIGSVSAVSIKKLLNKAPNKG